MISPRFLFAIHTPNLILRLNEPRYCLSKNVRSVLKRGVVGRSRVNQRRFTSVCESSESASAGPVQRRGVLVGVVMQ